MKKVILSIIILLVSMMKLGAQENVHSLYFLHDWSQRHTLNAAFAPSYGYFSLPVLGGVELSVRSNMGLSTFIYPPVAGTTQYVTFLNKSVAANLFLDKLSPSNYIDQRLSLNLFSLGFYTSQNSFWSFDLYLKEKLNMNLPKDLFKMMKLGMTSSFNSFDLKDLGVNQSNYLQASLGYSRDITKQLRVGVNAKLLLGLSAERINYSQFDVNLNATEYKIKAEGESMIMSNILSFEKDAQNHYDLTKPVINSGAKTAGTGVAFDLGVTYKPIPKLTLAAGINDLGSIKWKGASIQRGIAATNFSFAGFTDLNSDSIDSKIDQLTDDASALIKFKDVGNSDNFKDVLPYNVNVSAEYSIFGNYKHDILVGLLWRNEKYATVRQNDIVGAITFKPFSSLSISGTYEVSSKDYNRLGLALNLAPKWINLFIASDYIIPKVNPQFIPIDNAKFNITFGGSISLGKGRDKDKDGIADRFDLCPETPRGVYVNEKGCPVDLDGDGVPDFLDKCTDTPVNVKVDADGCPIDSDGDGVPDYLDKCPDTPKDAISTVDSNGCPKDSDGDGVADYLDKCPNTPAGVTVSPDGCPIDSDGDGVPDYLDKCPDTPAAAKGLVDSVGCPLDSDLDGVPDYLDLCNNTVPELRNMVDVNGCPKDSDGDGVTDLFDKCPDTPAAAHGMVDEHGCPRDTDGDGIPDYLDYCPKIAGVKSNHGCPELKKEIRTLFQKAMLGIQFETGKDVIKKESNVILNQIARVLMENPTYTIEVQGHTDNVGSVELNNELSDKRAHAVRIYLIEKGIGADRITAKGYGDSRPVASNSTAQGRTKNRRVEFIVSFEEIKSE